MWIMFKWYKIKPIRKISKFEWTTTNQQTIYQNESSNHGKPLHGCPAMKYWQLSVHGQGLKT